MFDPLNYPQTIQSAYEYFNAHGISIAEWSRKNDLPYAAVKDVLLNRARGVRGNAHKAAVCLGLKKEPKK